MTHGLVSLVVDSGTVLFIVTETLGLNAKDGKSSSKEGNLVLSLVIAIFEGVDFIAMRELNNFVAVIADVNGKAIGAKVGIVITIVVLEVDVVKIVESKAIAIEAKVDDVHGHATAYPTENNKGHVEKTHSDTLCGDDVI